MLFYGFCVDCYIVDYARGYIITTHLAPVQARDLSLSYIGLLCTQILCLKTKTTREAADGLQVKCREIDVRITVN